MMKGVPTKPGVYWAALDDGEKIVEIALLRLSYYHKCDSFEQGVVIHFVDDTRREAATGPVDFANLVIRPGVEIVLASRSTSYDDEVRVTWLAEVKPGRGFPKVGEACR